MKTSTIYWLGGVLLVAVVAYVIAQAIKKNKDSKNLQSSLTGVITDMTSAITGNGGGGSGVVNQNGTVVADSKVLATQNATAPGSTVTDAPVVRASVKDLRPAIKVSGSVNTGAPDSSILVAPGSQVLGSSSALGSRVNANSVML